MDKQKTISRKELYNLIWSKPLTTLSKELEIPGFRLRNVCKNHDIPMPISGHWMKLKYGKSLLKTPLPPDADEQIVIDTKNDSTSIDGVLLSDYQSIRKEISKDTSLSFIVPQKLVNPDPIIKNSKKIVTEKLNLRQKFYKKREFEKVEYFVPEVSKELLPRAFRILDIILKALRKRGHKLDFYEDRSNVVINGMEISLRLREKHKRIKVESDRYSNFKLIPTGILIFRITRSLHSKEWSGSENTPIEEKILTILTGMELFAKNEKEYQAELERGWEEQRIRREKEEKIKVERNAELKLLKKLIDQSEQWHKVQKFRTYINHLEKLNSKDYSEERDKLINWAREKADWMDPLTAKEEELFEKIDPFKIWNYQPPLF